MSTEKIVANDPRDLYARMSRREIWRALKKFDIQFPVGIDVEKGISLLQANNISPEQAIEWEQVTVQNEDKTNSVQLHPVRVEPHHSEEYLLKRNEEMERRIEQAVENEKASGEQITDLQTQINQLAKQNEELTKLLLGMRKESQEKAVKEKDPAKMKYMAFKKWCKERGHDLQKGENREELIKRLSDG